MASCCFRARLVVAALRQDITHRDPNIATAKAASTELTMMPERSGVFTFFMQIVAPESSVWQ
jgi:hypothetical protein